MLNFLCADQSNGSSIVIYIILAVMLVAMLILPYFTNKKRNQQYMDMLSGIHVGDLVKTAGGIIGRVTKITDKGEIKTVILETGSKTEKSYMEFDMTSIYCVLKSTKVEENKEEVKAEENPVETKEDVKAEETPVEANAEEVKVEEPKAEKPKKTAAKKTTAKKTAGKTTSKKTTK